VHCRKKRKEIPIILFRKVIEGAESAVQEEVAIMVRGYVLDLVYSFGAFIPPALSIAYASSRQTNLYYGYDE
jgi:hypothetical protein